MGYPERLLGDDESILRELRPHWRMLIPAALWTALTMAALVVLSRSPLGLEGGLQTAVVVFVLVVWLVVVGARVTRWWFTQYVLTTERIVVRTGMVARSGTEIPLERISNVLFNQGVFERLLGFGDVLIESAGSQGQSRLANIPDPEAFQSEVYRARELRAFTPQGSQPAPRDTVGQLEALADLHDRGALTDDEFRAQKRRLLEG